MAWAVEEVIKGDSMGLESQKSKLMVFRVLKEKKRVPLDNRTFM